MAVCIKQNCGAPVAPFQWAPSSTTPLTLKPVARCDAASCDNSSRTAAYQRRRHRPPQRRHPIAAAAVAPPELEWNEGSQEELGPAAQATLSMLDWSRLCGQVSGARAAPL